ncbi:MAG: DNA polymerase III subunit beta [Bacilli bacterium]|nr:DNA polymerase III subunit beta [Bacilli bacterium]
MKLEIKQNVLLEHLNYVIRGISTKNLRPILNCIKFELTEDGLYLMSTDNEISIKTFIDKMFIKKIDTLGEIVVSGKYIYDIVRKLPDENINLEEVIDAKLYITTTNSSFTLNCSNVNEFPDLELEFNKNPIILNQKTFKTIINQTAYATSVSETRPVLTGINFKIEKDIMECTATDSYRLAVKKIKLEEKVSEKTNIIIPTKNLNELIKLMNNDEDNLEMHIFGNKVVFKFNEITMMTRLISGTYPDTSKLIPEEFELEMKVNYDDFYSAIDRASLLTNESDKNTIKFQTKNKQAIISSNIPEIGNVEEKITVEKNNDNEIKIAFNSKFMMDAIRALESSEIVLMFNGEIKPIIIKNPDNDDLTELILPIRTY